MDTIEIPQSRYAGNDFFRLVPGHFDLYRHECGKCGGTGFIPEYGFNANGQCFRCNGTGTVLGNRTTAELDKKQEAFDKRAAAKEAKRLAECAKRDERVALFTAAEPELSALLKAEYDNFNSNEGRPNRFFLSLAEQLHNVVGGRDLSEKQIEALRKSVAENIEKAAHAAENPVVEGRIEIHGKVISTKSDEGMYGTQYKMLVEDERGFRVFGTIPNNLWNEIEFLGAYRKSAWNETDGVMRKLVGMEIKFLATVEASAKDPSFGFFKRPTKAEVVA